MTVPGGLLTQPLGPPSGGPAAPVAPPTPVMAQGGPDDSAYEQGGANPNILDKILNRVMPTTQAYKGLLTPEQVSGARRQGLMQMGLSMLANSGPVDGRPAMSTAQALGVGGMQGMGAYQGAQQQALAQQQEAIQMHQNQRIIQARAAIAQQFAPVQGETQQQQLQRLANASAASYGAGDVQGGEGYAKTAEALKATRYSMGMLPGQMGVAPKLERVTLGSGQYGSYNPMTGEITPSVDKDGKPVMSNAITPGERADKQADLDTRASNAAAATGERGDVRDYNSAIKDYRAKAVMLTGARNGIAALMSPDPQVRMAALKNVPGIQSALEPVKPSLRQGLVHYYSNIDSSIPGKIMQAIDQGTIGQLPPDQVAALGKFVNQTALTYKGAVERQYQSALQKNPKAAYDNPDTIFGPDSDWGGAAAPKPSGAGKTTTTTTAKAGGAATAVAKPANYSKDNPFAQAPAAQ